MEVLREKRSDPAAGLISPNTQLDQQLGYQFDSYHIADCRHSNDSLFI
jgi:hypothetical protein